MNLLQRALEILGLGTAKTKRKKVPLSRRHRAYRQVRARQLLFEQVEDRRVLATVSATAMNPTVTEGSPAVIYFNVSPPSSSPITVNYQTVAGTATQNVDYQGVTGTATIAPGQSFATVSVSTLTDSLTESAETFSVTITGATGATVGTASATVTINDATPASTVSPTPSSSQFSEGNPALVYVYASPPSSTPIQFTYQTSSGTATQNTDYQAASGTGTIAANMSYAVISIQTLTDSFVEGSEAFNFTLTGATGATLGTASTSVTIADVAPSTVNISAVGNNVPEGAPATIRFYASPPSSSAITVNYQTLAGTAIENFDYQGAAGSVTIGANQSYASLSVSAFHDFVIDPGETFEVQITGVTGGVLGTASTTIAIADVPPRTITVADASGMEAAESTGVKFTATLSETSTSAVTFKFKTRDWNSVEAKEDVDYAKLVDSVVTIPAGTLTKDFYVPILLDEIDEYPDHFDIDLYDALFAVIVDDKAVGTILDDDAEPSIAVSLADGTTGLVEGDSGDNQRTAKVTLTGQTEKTVSVDLSIAELFNPPAAVAAKADKDFRAATVHLTFLPGDQSEDFVITVIGDVIDEEDEVLGVRLTGATNATYSTQATTFAILDDDAPPVLTFEATESVTEDDEGVSYSPYLEVSVSQASEKVISVSYDVTDGTATLADNDYGVQTTLTITIPAGEAGQPIYVSVRGDFRDESDENFSVTLKNPVNATLGAAKTCVVTIVDDDDSPTLTVPASLASIEGRSPPASGISAAAGSATPGGVTISAQGLPHGVTMDAAGVLSGRLHYDTAGTKTITVTASDSYGNTASKSFPWQISDAPIDTLFVAPAGSTDDGEWIPIYGHHYRGVSMPPQQDAEMWTETYLPHEGPIESDIKYFRYLYSGNQSAPGSPNYNTDPPTGAFGSERVRLASLSQTNNEFVEVGIDVNLDGKLAAGEITHSFIIGPKSLMYGQITSRRTEGSLGVEPNAYLLKTDEHHEAGGEFEFSTRNTAASSYDVGYELEVNGQLRTSGRGNTFRYQFTSADKGYATVFFFIDLDGDGTRDLDEGHLAFNPSLACTRLQTDFLVKDIKDLTAAVAYLDTLTVSADAVQTLFTADAKLASMKDSDSDYRALITMTVLGTPLPVANGATYPGKVIVDGDWDVHAVNYADYRIHLIDDITYPVKGVGLSTPAGAPKVAVVDWGEFTLNTFVHEFGHICGIPHAGHDSRHIMATGGPGNEVTNGDADEYEGGFDN